MQFNNDSSEDEEDLAVAKTKKVYCRINFSQLSDNSFLEKFRLCPEEVQLVLNVIGRHLKEKTVKNQALSERQQLLVALHWMALGTPYHGIADMHGVTKGTVCKTIKKVVNVICRNLSPQIIKWPADPANIPTEFFRLGGFPSVAGAIDGTLIPLQAPSQHEDQYVNRHGKHSLNAMAVCGPDYRFYYVNSRFPGSVHDSRVLRASHLSTRFEEGWRPFPNAVILGDSGYGLKSWLIPPLHRRPDDEVERRFNAAHKRTRRIIENSFGILKNRFQCLKYLRLSPEFAALVVIASCTLHNIARKQDFFEEVEGLDNEEVAIIGDQNLAADQGAQDRLDDLLNFFRQ